MKYYRSYEPAWDEVFQIEIADDDPLIDRMPLEIRAGLTGVPHVGIPIRPRSREEADKERTAERGEPIAP